MCRFTLGTLYTYKLMVFSDYVLWYIPNVDHATTVQQSESRCNNTDPLMWRVPPNTSTIGYPHTLPSHFGDERPQWFMISIENIAREPHDTCLRIRPYDQLAYSTLAENPQVKGVGSPLLHKSHTSAATLLRGSRRITPHSYHMYKIWGTLTMTFIGWCNEND